MKASKSSLAMTYIFLAFGLLLIFLPLYLTVITAFKTEGEITKSFFAWPEQLYLGNFQAILSQPEYIRIVFNTMFITTAGLFGIVALLPMAAYSISRQMNEVKFYKILYFVFLSAIFIPFQVKMMPLVKIMGRMNMMNLPGIVVVYVASSICEVIFLYEAYITSIPADLEESAYIDGASTAKIYASIIFPLLKPMTATVLIKNGLWFWNDFFLPLLVLNKSKTSWTLTLFQYNFKSNMNINYTLTFAAFFLSMLPIIIVYLILQKHIIGGLTTGAVKG